MSIVRIKDIDVVLDKTAINSDLKFPVGYDDTEVAEVTTVGALNEWSGSYNGIGVSTSFSGDIYVQLSGQDKSQQLWAYVQPGTIQQNTWQFVSWSFDGSKTSSLC